LAEPQSVRCGGRLSKKTELHCVWSDEVNRKVAERTRCISLGWVLATLQLIASFGVLLRGEGVKNDHTITAFGQKVSGFTSQTIGLSPYQYGERNTSHLSLTFMEKEIKICKREECEKVVERPGAKFCCGDCAMKHWDKAHRIKLKKSKTI